MCNNATNLHMNIFRTSLKLWSCLHTVHYIIYLYYLLKRKFCLILYLAEQYACNPGQTKLLTKCRTNGT